MALDRIKGRVAFICDECQDGLETDDYEFSDALKVAKEHGWKNIKKEDYPYNAPKVPASQKYLNICSHCYNNQ